MRQRKRINSRQWWHRLVNRKCWNCDVPLEYVQAYDGRSCPRCLTFYSETALVAHESRVRSVWRLRPWRAASYLDR